MILHAKHLNIGQTEGCRYIVLTGHAVFMNNTVMGWENDQKSNESDCILKRSKVFVFYCNVARKGISSFELLF